jgi:VCBS repeat-containing protein
VNFGGTAVTYDPNGRFRGLGEGETAADSFAYSIADHDGSISTASVTVTIHGLNDTPTAKDNGGSTDEDTPVTLHVLANDTDPDVHDTLTVTSINTSSTRGQVTLNADGSITYDPRGQFDSLDAGQTDHDSFTYRVSDGHGGTDDATVTVAISGKPDTERLVDSFEASFLSQNRTSSIVTTAGQYQESDGAHGLYTPTDGQYMARLEAYGTTAQKVGSETVSKLETFLGIPDRSLPKDPVDNTFPANGSAFKLKLSVQAGDEISFDWMFDARDFVNSPPDGKADDDFAVFTVAGGASPELFKLSDIRQTGDQGATGWRSSIYKASAAADLTIGFGVVNDRIADAPREHNSFLLVDNVRLNRDFDQGYQLVDHQADGRFETVVHT